MECGRADGPIDCGNAGTLARLLAGILAGQERQAFELVGDESLSARPMERIAVPLGRMGANVETTDGHAPLRIVRAGAAGDRHTSCPCASAQVKSACSSPAFSPRARRPWWSRLRPGITRSGCWSAPAPGSRAGRRASRCSRRRRFGSRSSRSRATSRPPRRFLVAAAIVPGLVGDGARRRPQPAANGAARRPRADGRAGRDLQPAADRRRAGRGRRGSRVRARRRDRERVGGAER